MIAWLAVAGIGLILIPGGLWLLYHSTAEALRGVRQ